MNHTLLESLTMEVRNDFLNQAINLTGVGIVITDPRQEDNPIIYVNQAFESLTGYKSDEIIGRNCRFLQGEGKNNEREREQIRNAVHHVQQYIHGS